MGKTFERRYIRTCVGCFTCREDDRDVDYVIRIKSPYSYGTPEEAATEDVIYTFCIVDGHVVLVVGGDSNLLRDYHSDIIEWKDWQQYHMARVNPDTGEEEPCSTNWDDLFGVRLVNSDFTTVVIPCGYNVFSYENI